MYKDQHASRVWLGAGGEEDGRPVEILRAGAPSLLESRPTLVPKRDPFTEAARDSTLTAARVFTKIGRTELATTLRNIIATKGGEQALGLSFERKFEAGKIGFPGSITTSRGGSVAVRVLSGLPDELWWHGSGPDPDPRSDAQDPAPVDVPREPTRVLDKPPSPKRKVTWSCSTCDKPFKGGHDCKLAQQHRLKCSEEAQGRAAGSGRGRGGDMRGRARGGRRSRKLRKVNTDSESSSSASDTLRASSSVARPTELRKPRTRRKDSSSSDTSSSDSWSFSSSSDSESRRRADDDGKELEPTRIEVLRILRKETNTQQELSKREKNILAHWRRNLDHSLHKADPELL